ncbi:TniB family NTP-binding protein [Cyanobacterium sp. Dongsha4]|nr:TniB family NTP-binding protein [Cyanobacterium sp. Dongsha4]
MGESRTGKTIACNSYRLRHKPTQENGKPPQVPVIYVQVPQECGARDLFQAIIEHLKYQMTKGTVSEIRKRTMTVLQRCGVEMIILNEAGHLPVLKLKISKYESQIFMNQRFYID